MPPPTPVSDVARRYADDQEALSRTAVQLVDSDALTGNEEQWRQHVVSNGQSLLLVQQAAATQADPYLDEVLVAQGASPASQGVVEPAAFVDQSDGGGSWLYRLLYAPLATFDAAVSAGVGLVAARARARFVASSVAMNGVRDVGRAAVTTAMITRPSAKLYVRMLNGKTCARCAILAGRRYRVSAFRRHPRCDCFMIPAAEDASDDWATDPTAYFRSLSRDEQDATFTAAGAEAIRAGGVTQIGMGQVVNAYRGVTVVNAYGRDVRATLEGTTTRGLYGGYEVQDDGTLRKRPLDQTERRNGRRFATAPRLMPDEIFQLAEAEGWSREETLRQLRRFAYVV